MARLAAAVIGGTFFAVTVVGGIALSVENQGRIALGVSSEGTVLGGMTRDEAAAWFAAQEKQKLNRKAIILQDGKKQYTIDAKDISLTAQSEAAADAAYAVGRGQSPLRNIVDQMRYAITGIDIPLKAAYDQQALHAHLDAVKQDVDKKPVNASVTINEDGSIKHTPAVIGRTIDMDRVQEQIEPKLAQLDLTIRIPLEPVEQPPDVTDDDLASVQGVLAAYSTTFVPGDRGRNIHIAASKLQDALVRSGSVLSFNDTVGARTKDAGYRDAGVIIEGRAEQDIGGGVCQVSSTLYNAILLAGLTPTMRTSHFYPSAYCPPGLDATVADGLIDFQFRNDLPHNVLLKVGLTMDTVTIYVLGTPSDLGGQTVRLSREGSPLQPSIYRLWYQGGLAKKEFLHTDSYSEKENG